MHDPHIDTQARLVIQERLARAAQPRVPQPRRRHRLAGQLRRFADRLDN
ncbi:hypothetical protein [Nocardioides sp.]